jgi:hypothetical protein
VTKGSILWNPLNRGGLRGVFAAGGRSAVILGLYQNLHCCGTLRQHANPLVSLPPCCANGKNNPRPCGAPPSEKGAFSGGISSPLLGRGWRVAPGVVSRVLRPGGNPKGGAPPRRANARAPCAHARYIKHPPAGARCRGKSTSLSRGRSFPPFFRQRKGAPAAQAKKAACAARRNVFMRF